MYLPFYTQILLHTCSVDKDAEISELQKQLKLSTQKDAASSKCLKALEAQVGSNWTS